MPVGIVCLTAGHADRQGAIVGLTIAILDLEILFCLLIYLLKFRELRILPYFLRAHDVGIPFFAILQDLILVLFCHATLALG